MKKILFVSAFVPCDKTAGQNYTRLLLTDLLKSNTIDLICFDAAHHQLDLYCKSMCRKIKVYSINNINIFFLSNMDVSNFLFFIHFLYRVLIFLLLISSIKWYIKRSMIGCIWIFLKVLYMVYFCTILQRS